MLMLVWIKQPVSNIWSLIYEKIKQHWLKLPWKNYVAYKKRSVYLNLVSWIRKTAIAVVSSKKKITVFDQLLPIWKRLFLQCVKSVQIRSFFWSVFSCIRTVYRKMRTRKNSVYGHFSPNESISSWGLD